MVGIEVDRLYIVVQFRSFIYRSFYYRSWSWSVYRSWSWSIYRSYGFLTTETVGQANYWTLERYIMIFICFSIDVAVTSIDIPVFVNFIA